LEGSYQWPLLPSNTKLDLFGMEVEDEEFFGLVLSSFPLAPADGVESCLSQDRVSAENYGGLHGAVRHYERFDSHRSGDTHFLGQ